MIDILKLLILGGAYFAFTAIIGRLLLSFFRIDFDFDLLNLFIGFIIIEISSFFLFCVLGFLDVNIFSFSLLPHFLILLFLLSKRVPISSAIKIVTTNLMGPIILFSLIFCVYIFSSYDQLFYLVSNEGVIYQDLIYHSGISNSILNFGFPVADLQYYGKSLNYHFFTHFLASKYAYVSGTPVIFSYHIFLNLIGVFFYSFFTYHIINSSVVSFKYSKSKELILSILFSVFSFFGLMLLGGKLSSSGILAFFFSASYLWQLVIFLAFYIVIICLLSKEDYQNSFLLIIGLLFSASVITKISSLPLLLNGVYAITLFSWFFKSKIVFVKWVYISFLLTFIGGILFFVFFGNDISSSSSIKFNYDLVNRLPLVAILGLKGSLLGFCILLASVFTFRSILLFDLKIIEVWFSLSVLLTGTLLSVLIADNQSYFLYPSVLFATLLSFRSFMELKKKIWIKICFIGLLLLSLYPISSLGNLFQTKFDEKANYSPLNLERVDLYKWISGNTPIDAVFFTTSVYSSSEMDPDNFYPAAISGRKFLLGGFRFGGLENDINFQARLDLVNNFNCLDRFYFDSLKEIGVSYILIEKTGNYNINLFSEVNNCDGNWYTIVYKSESGIIFELAD